MIENSPKIQNTSQTLPSINQAFSTRFTNLDSAATQPQSTVVAYDSQSNILDSLDSSLFDDFGLNVKSEEDANDFSSYNFNYTDFEDKPNREFKNIWEEEPKVINEMPKTEKKPKKKIKKEIFEDDDEEEEEEDSSNPQQLICLWKNCYQEFKTQSTLVSHIEKCHVSTAKTSKGDEYTCLWADCPRKYRSFNARYKLLIHMRVHSGEKPNKCPVSRKFLKFDTCWGKK